MTEPTPDWGFLLDRLQHATPGVSHAIAVSSDGLLIAKTQHLDRDSADHMAAFTSGESSLTNGFARVMGQEPVSQTTIEMRDGYVIIMTIGDGSILTVLATTDCDTGQVAYEMACLINSVGPALTPQRRVDVLR